MALRSFRSEESLASKTLTPPDPGFHHGVDERLPAIGDIDVVLSELSVSKVHFVELGHSVGNDGARLAVLNGADVDDIQAKRCRVIQRAAIRREPQTVSGGADDLGPDFHRVGRVGEVDSHEIAGNRRRGVVGVAIGSEVTFVGDDPHRRVELRTQFGVEQLGMRAVLRNVVDRDEAGRFEHADSGADQQAPLLVDLQRLPGTADHRGLDQYIAECRAMRIGRIDDLNPGVGTQQVRRPG